MKIGIVGVGVVGGAVKYGMEKLGHDVKVHDIRLGTSIEDVRYTDLCFICVPTPENPDGSCNTSIVESVIEDLDCMHYEGVICVKSTVRPGFTKGWNNIRSEEGLKPVCFVPEFLRERCAISDFTENHDVCVIGTHSQDDFETIKRAHGKYPQKFVMMTPTEAELCKYFSNVYNAMRVVFANGFYEVCKKLGARYSVVKDAVVERPTILDLYLDCNEKFRGFAGVCVVPETKIYTSGGLKRIDEIKIGDKVYTIDGSLQNVEEIFVRKVKNERMWRIKGQGVGEFVITSEHPVFAMQTNRFHRTIGSKLKLMNSKEGEFGWVNAEELEKGDLIALPKFGVNTRLSSGMSEDMARLLGYYAAEGSLENDSNRVALAFHSNENEYMDDVDSIVSKMGGRTHIQKDGNKAQQRFSHVLIRKKCLEDVGRYSDKKELSVNLMQANTSCIENFLCGYFRGDGHISKNRFTIATVSQKLFEQLKLLLLRLGISFNTVERQKYKGQDGVVHKKAYYIKVSNNSDLQAIRRIMNLDVKLKAPKFERKTSWFDVFGDKHLMAIPIKSIEKVRYSGDVYNLEVSGNNTYIVEDAIVHNCLPKDTAAFAKLAEDLDVDAGIFRTIVEDNKLYRPTVSEGMRMS